MSQDIVADSHLRKRTADPQPGQKSTIPEESLSKSSRAWFKWDIERTEWDILLASTALKLLLYPAYRSTDFEVHRNWLAITHSLPISRWYFDTTSEWTLDYPPFFAYFEKLLSIPAYFVDRKIVNLSNLNYDSWSVVAYQRTTVILTELVLGIVLIKFIRSAVDPTTQRIISTSIFLHPGFLIVDHIHFQYNGFLFGILLWSIFMAKQGNKLGSGILFAVLLNFKHIYMYLAPAYFIYLLRSFCMTPSGQPEIKNFVSLANAVIGVFFLSFGPFMLMGQIPQVLSRLFPFTRGLNHAYWAPNFWALVTAFDRVLLFFVKSTGLGIPINESGVTSTSRGLVGDTIFAVIPNVKPIHTFIVTLAFQSVILFKLWRNPTYKSFLTALTLCGYTAFLFGWHVHEKAVLLFLVPLSLLAAEKHAYFRTFILCNIAGIFGLFPLIFTPGESIIKVLYSAMWLVLVYISLYRQVYEYPKSLIFVLLDVAEKAYLFGFPFLLAFVTLFHTYTSRMTLSSEAVVHDDVRLEKVVESTMEFLPLMTTSVYCAIGIVWGYLKLLCLYIEEERTY